MTVTLPPSRRRTVSEWKQLAGWMNWALNVFPLLKPGLCNVYEKISGRSEAYKKLYLNEAVKGDLEWFLGHVERSSGILLFDALDWDPAKETNLTILCDACMSGMGFWIPELLLGFYAHVPCNPPKDTIFFWEALCVVAALEWFCLTMRADASLTARLWVTIKTNNSNTVALFDSLHALPSYNSLLRAAVDLLLAHDVDVRVLHIPGCDHEVADAISRHKFDDARAYAPRLWIRPFEPPSNALGAAKK